jgi:hypothetical protein
MKGMDVLASSGAQSLGRRILAGASVLVLVTACSAGGAGTASPLGVASPSAVTAPSASVVASPTSAPAPSATAAPTPEPSLAANCMDPATADLLIKNLGHLDKLSAAQLTTIVAALKAMDDPATAEWRQGLVANIEKQDWFAAGTFAMSIVSGQLTLKKCGA